MPTTLIEALREFAEQAGMAAHDHSYKLPPRITYAALHDALKAGGFVIYAGAG